MSFGVPLLSPPTTRTEPQGVTVARWPERAAPMSPADSQVLSVGLKISALASEELPSVPPSTSTRPSGRPTQAAPGARLQHRRTYREGSIGTV